MCAMCVMVFLCCDEEAVSVRKRDDDDNDDDNAGDAGRRDRNAGAIECARDQQRRWPGRLAVGAVGCGTQLAGRALVRGWLGCAFAHTGFVGWRAYTYKTGNLDNEWRIYRLIYTLYTWDYMYMHGRQAGRHACKLANARPTRLFTAVRKVIGSRKFSVCVCLCDVRCSHASLRARTQA